MKVAVIGGTGAHEIVPASASLCEAAATPYGDPSAALRHWYRDSTEFFFLARHGTDGNIPPHLVNYRANIDVIAGVEPDHVVALNAVGGIADDAHPGMLAFPDQIIDYTWGRAHTFADGNETALLHAEFTEPVSAQLRRRLLERCRALGLSYLPGGVYGVTQGPRLETAAEIERMARDGCTLVGMTAMPEAGLARERKLDFAICAVIVNRAAGRGNAGAGIHDEIAASIERGMLQASRLLDTF